MALSYWRAGRLTAKNGGFRPGQWLPAATVLYNRWFENQGFCRCTCCCKPQDPDKPPEGWGKAIGTGVAIGLPLALVFSGYFFWLGGQVSQRWPIVFYGTSTSTSASARATPPPSTRAPSCSSAARWRASRAATQPPRGPLRTPSRGGQDAIYAKAYFIGALMFVIVLGGVTLRVATTVHRTDEVTPARAELRCVRTYLAPEHIL